MPSLVIAKAVRDFFKNKQIKTSDSAVKALSSEVEKLCLKACDNVKASKAKIVKDSHVPKIDAFLSDITASSQES